MSSSGPLTTWCAPLSAAMHTPTPPRARVVLIQGRLDPGRGSEHRRHRPRPGQRPDERPAGGGEPQPVLQIEHPRGLRRRDLPEAVSEHHVGAYPDARPQGREGAFERVDRGLLPLRIVEFRLRPGPAEHDVEKGAAALAAQQRVATVQHRPHHRFPLVEVEAHAGPLARLPGIGEGHLRGRPRRRTLLRRGERPEAVPERRGVPEREPRPEREVAPPDPGRPREVGKRCRLLRRFAGRPPRGPFVEPRDVMRGQIAKRSGGLPRERQDPEIARNEPFLRPGRTRERPRKRREDRGRRACRPPRSAVHRGVMRFSVAPDDDVRVGAGEPERAHPRERRAAGRARPVRRGRGHPDGQAIPVDLGIGILEVEMPRDHPLAHREQHLDEPRGPRPGREVADVGLDRSHEERPVRLPPPAVDRRHRVHLGRVPESRPGPVRLQVVHPRGLDPGPRQRLLDHPLLGGALRGGQTGADPVLVHRRTVDHPPDPVAGRLRLVEAPKHQHPAAFAPHEAVRPFVERPAPAGRRQHSGVGERFGRQRREDHAHAARERQIGLPALETGHRMVHRDERRRARRVHRDRRPLQAQREGDPPARGAEAVAGDQVQGRVGSGAFVFAANDLLVLVAPDPDVDPAPAAHQPVRTDAGVLERLPAQLQQQPLLRVQRLRLERRDPEELRVELVDTGQERTESRGVVHGHLIREHLPHAPFAVTGRAVGDRAPAGLEEPPEVREVLRAGKPAGHAHDGDRCVAPRVAVRGHRVGAGGRCSVGRLRFHPLRHRGPPLWCSKGTFRSLIFSRAGAHCQPSGIPHRGSGGTAGGCPPTSPAPSQARRTAARPEAPIIRGASREPRAGTRNGIGGDPELDSGAHVPPIFCAKNSANFLRKRWSGRTPTHGRRAH